MNIKRLAVILVVDNLSNSVMESCKWWIM